MYISKIFKGIVCALLLPDQSRAILYGFFTYTVYLYVCMYVSYVCSWVLLPDLNKMMMMNKIIMMMMMMMMLVHL